MPGEGLEPRRSYAGGNSGDNWSESGEQARAVVTAGDWSRAGSNGVTRRASRGEVMAGDLGGSLRRVVRVRAEVER
jgi:hypothetical protein